MSTTDERIRKRKGFKSPMLILGFTMTFIYFVLGIYFLSNAKSLPGIPNQFRIAFAAMLMVYGAYRSWRIYTDYYRN